MYVHVCIRILLSISWHSLLTSNVTFLHFILLLNLKCSVKHAYKNNLSIFVGKKIISFVKATKCPVCCRFRKLFSRAVLVFPSAVHKLFVSCSEEETVATKTRLSKKDKLYGVFNHQMWRWETERGSSNHPFHKLVHKLKNMVAMSSPDCC